MGLLVVSSCGLGGQPASQPRPVGCQLLTRTDAAEAIGVKESSMADPTPVTSGTDSCKFATRPDSGPDAGNTVDLQVFQHGSGSTARAVFDQLEKSADGRPVTGVGQGAYLSTDACGELTVLQGSAVVDIRLFTSTIPNCSDAQAVALRTLGRKVASRI